MHINYEIMYNTVKLLRWTQTWSLDEHKCNVNLIIAEMSMHN